MPESDSFSKFISKKLDSVYIKGDINIYKL